MACNFDGQILWNSCESHFWRGGGGDSRKLSGNGWFQYDWWVFRSDLDTVLGSAEQWPYTAKPPTKPWYRFRSPFLALFLVGFRGLSSQGVSLQVSSLQFLFLLLGTELNWLNCCGVPCFFLKVSHYLSFEPKSSFFQRQSTSGWEEIVAQQTNAETSTKKHDVHDHDDLSKSM